MTKVIYPNQSGFTLVEVAIILMLVGLVIGAVFSFKGQQLDNESMQITVMRQKKIAGALALYAQKNGSLPCPALSYGATRGQATIGCWGGPGFTGIIPFINLGLSRDDAFDGYGRLFTYGVAEEAVYPSSANVHGNCRINAVWNIAGVNINPEKSAFCCQQSTVGRSLKVFSDDAKSQPVSPIQGSISGTFQSVNTPEAATVAERLTYMAYAIISHGKNQAETISWDYWNRTAQPADMSDEEKENSDSDNEYITIPERVDPYFDDIILWRTQEMVMNEFGNNSCSVP